MMKWIDTNKNDRKSAEQKGLHLWIMGFVLYGLELSPVIADDGHEGDVFAISGMIFVFIIIGFFYQMMKSHQKNNTLVFERMNATLMEGQLAIIMAHLENLVDSIEYKCQRDCLFVLAQFHQFVCVDNILWRNQLLDLAKQSALSKSNQQCLNKALNQLLDLRKFEKVIQVYSQDEIMRKIILSANEALNLFRKVKRSLVVE